MYPQFSTQISLNFAMLFYLALKFIYLSPLLCCCCWISTSSTSPVTSCWKPHLLQNLCLILVIPADLNLRPKEYFSTTISFICYLFDQDITFVINISSCTVLGVLFCLWSAVGSLLVHFGYHLSNFLVWDLLWYQWDSVLS